MSKQSKYFAADEASVVVSTLEERAKDWFLGIQQTSYLSKIERSWRAYYGDFFDEGNHAISFGGESGEIVNIAVNHYRNLARHVHVMVTSTRPSFQCRAVNTDKKSLVQAKLGNGLLDYYMREKRLEEILKQAVEYAIVLGSGYVKLEWNSTRGEIVDYLDPEPEAIFGEDEEGNYLDEEGEIIELIPIYQGDVEFSLVSPYDVVFDSTKEYYDKNDWVVVRNAVNKYDLAAKYPEKSEEILRVDTVDKANKAVSTKSYSKSSETESIYIKEFFHKRTESRPNGRYMLYINEELVLEDTDLPYRDLPLFRIVPSSIMGTPYGYSDMFDLLPLQEFLNSMYSTAATNISAFGIQSILSPREAGIEFEQVSSGMQFIKYNASAGGGKPEAMQLTATSPEVYQMMNLLVSSMETISGVNSVARGNPEQSLRSGTALALVQSQALQYVSGLQQSYVRLLEDVGTGLLNLLKDFAQEPRIAAIAGINNTTEMKTFKADDIKSVNRVIVEPGNALMQCLQEGTEVLMYDGSYKEVQNISVGDLVMGWDSQPKTVEQTGSGFEEMFEVRTKSKKDDHIYTCNRSHIMTLKYCSDYKDNKKGDVIDISVKDYLELSKKEQDLLMGFRTDVEFEKKEVPLSPYYLGLWIGDGNRNNTSVTTCDNEISTYLSEYAMELNMFTRRDNQNGKAWTYHITTGESHGDSRRNHIMNSLRDLELIQNKHVPYVYKYNDQDTLLNLLAGFIDADGTLVDQTFIIHQVDDRITDDMEFIARSLGFKVNKTKKTRTSDQLYGSKDTIEYNILSIGGDTWKIPTKVERKQSQEVTKQKDWRNYGINLVSKGHGKYYGFTLKEDPHFLLKDFTVTHNTTAGRVQVAENLLQMGLVDNIDKYLMILNTGNLDYMTDGKIDNLTLIKSENEAMLRGESTQAIWSERHSMHIKEHMELLNDVELKKDAVLVQLVLDHVQEHINLLQTTDPIKLSFIGETPLAPPPNPNNIGQQGQLPSAPPAQGGQAVSIDQGNAGIAQPQNSQPANLPSLPNPAGEGTILPEGMPVKPEDL